MHSKMLPHQGHIEPPKALIPSAHEWSR